MIFCLRFFYSGLFYLLTPILLVRLWIKGRSLPAYRLRIAERFALAHYDAKQVDVWIHAVSLGEMIAISPLIEALLKKKQVVLVTCMTPTGSARAQQQFAGRILHYYLPYDLPFALKRFFAAFKPRQGIIVETELWPNVIHYARRANVSLSLFNARLSDQSFRSYRRFAWIFQPLLNQFKGIYTQTAEDSGRFCSLGAASTRVHRVGNIKFDLETKTIEMAPYEALKKLWGAERVTILLASTHEDEERQLLQVHRRLQALIPQVLLLIAPRHPERFATVYQLAREKGFSTGLRSDLSTFHANNEVIVLDSLGELLGFYAVSDYAFVGGSLVPIGGHNVLEPIAMDVAVLVGPFVNNFRSICRDLLAVGGIIQIQSPEEWLVRLEFLYKNNTERSQMQNAAKRILELNRGVLGHYLAILDQL